MDAPSLKDSVVHAFLRESNAIEDVHGIAALRDARAAWDFLIIQCARAGFVATMDDIPRTLSCVHGILMRRQNPRIAGKLRDCNVRVGSHVAPHWNLVRGELDRWVCRFHYDTVMDPDEHARITHVEFERIHPFEDGNGRVGRILYNAHRVVLGLPIHIIQASERQDYYRWFR